MLKHLQSREDWAEKNLAAKGFTLIELLVVIVILGILAAVVVFAVSGIQDRGQTSACKTDKRTLTVAIEAWNASPRTGATANAYPSNETDLVTAGFLDAESDLYNLTGGNAGGTVKPTVVTAGNPPCA